MLSVRAAARRPCADAVGVSAVSWRGVDAALLFAAAALPRCARRRPAGCGHRFATRAPGEPAWHRRARRARADARVLVRLDAARQRLNSHHSAPHSRMLRRGGGGGAGGGGNTQAARQLLLSLFDGAFTGNGQGPRRGGGGSRGGGGKGLGSRPRDGEWPCICGFATNRPYREACFSCGRARNIAEIGGAAGAKGNGGQWLAGSGGQKGGRPYTASEGNRGGTGPMGAGGTRPILGGRGRDLQGLSTYGGHGKGVASVSNWTGKGPSLPAAEGKAAVCTWGGHGGDRDKGKGANKGGAGGAGDEGKAAPTTGKVGCKGSWTRPPTIVDDEGYELVQPRRVRDKEYQKEERPAMSQRTCGGGAEAASRRRWSDEGDSDDDDLFDERVNEADDDAGAGEDGIEEVDPRRMRATFEEHARAVREMERKGTYGPALETLRAARDEAEKKWRDNKPPAPLPKRLNWAEAKVRKAQAALTRARMELDAFDEEADRRRAELSRRIQEAQGWYDWRRQQLDMVHEEAADRAPGRRSVAADGGGTGELRWRIRSQTLPEIHAILEEVQEGTPLHERLALVVAGLADAEARDQQREEGPVRYHMDDDDSMLDQWGEDDQEGREDDDAGGARHGEHWGHGQGDRPTGWRPEGPGRWSRNGGQKGEGRQPRTTEAAAADVGEGPKDTGKASDSPSINGNGGTSTDGDDGERAGKHRRRQTAAEAEQEERMASDARRAQELQKQLECATAAQVHSYQSGMGGFGSEAALCAAAQKFVLDVQRAQAQAGELGIDARADDGRTLLELSPAELSRWVEDHLGEGGMRD